jgi:hypothetical protein
MSAEAVATLRQLWEKLTFTRVKRVIAREPEDVLSIKVPNIITTEEGLMLCDHTRYYVHSRRTKDIPPDDRWCARIAWRHYFGFTLEGIYFQKDNYHGLDCDIDLTMDFSRYGNHTGGFDKPPVGSLIGGEVTEGPKGKRFQRWFYCLSEFKFLVDIVLNGTDLTEDEIAAQLITGGHPDTYWAIARLVLFDNVQAFVDQLKEEQPPHPCQGQEYTSSGFCGTKRPKVYWDGMYLPKEASQYVHEISYRLNEPRWWQEFVQLADDQGVKWEHPASGGICNACEAERLHDDDLLELG